MRPLARAAALQACCHRERSEATPGCRTVVSLSVAHIRLDGDAPFVQMGIESAGHVFAPVFRCANLIATLETLPGEQSKVTRWHRTLELGK